MKRFGLGQAWEKPSVWNANEESTAAREPQPWGVAVRLVLFSVRHETVWSWNRSIQRNVGFAFSTGKEGYVSNESEMQNAGTKYGGCHDTIPGLCRVYRYIAKGSHDCNALLIYSLAGITRMAFKAEILAQRDGMSIICQRRERSGKN